MLPNPADPSVRGPYPVSNYLFPGTFTERNLTLEAWFPATPGSETGATNLTLDIRDFLSAKAAAKVPDSDVPHPVYEGAYVGLSPAWQQSELSGDSPLPSGFPLIVFVHGTAGWRSQSLSLMVHWASRGFAVLAADYPGICLKDLLDLVEQPLQPPHPKTDQAGDTKLLMAELRSMSDPRLRALLGGGAVNVSQNALIGHSAGAMALENLGDEARVLIPMAGRGTRAGSALTSTLVVSAFNDSTVPRASQQLGFDLSPPSKRLLVGENMGHQAFSDLCYIGEDQGGITGIGKDNGIWEAFLFAPLAVDGCSFHDPAFFEPPKNWRLIEYGTSAVLEETLRCDDEMAEAFRNIDEALDYVAEVKEVLR